MSTFKPTVFVGSSSEALPVARQFCLALGDVAYTICWTDAPEFEAMRSTLDGLLMVAERYDFGLFIMTPDDELVSRGVRGKSARDNVILELGMFLGKLGPERAFAVVEEGKKPEDKIKAISDLFGISIPRFARIPEAALIASVSNAAAKIRPLIASRGLRATNIQLLSKWNYEKSTSTFTATVSATKLLKAKTSLDGKDIMLACRVQDPGINLEDDPRVAMSKPRSMSDLHLIDITFSVKSVKLFGRVTAQDIIEGHVILVPKGADVRKAKTINDLRALGCQIVEGVGKRAGRLR